MTAPEMKRDAPSQSFAGMSVACEGRTGWNADHTQLQRCTAPPTRLVTRPAYDDKRGHNPGRTATYCQRHADNYIQACKRSGHAVLDMPL